MAFCLEPNDALISEIIANENVCVRAYVDDKIYLDAEKIMLTQEGLFLSLDNRNSLHLPTLHSDKNGCYVQAAIDPSVLNKCHYCGNRYFVYCTNSECQSKVIRKNYEEERKRNKEESKRKKQEEKTRK